MATSAILAQKLGSIGKPVRGVRAKILDNTDSPKERLRQRIVGTNTIGWLCIRSAWTTSKKNWIETGDLAYRDLDGDLFLCRLSR